MGLKKHYKRLTKSEFDYIKGLFSQGYTYRQIMDKTGRTYSTLNYISRAASLEEYLKRNLDMREALARKRLTSFSADKEFIQDVEASLDTESSLDQGLARIDSKIDELKEAIVEVVEMMVERKVADYKQEKEQEISDLKEVVELAKQSSIAGRLKSKWMGQ